MSRIASKATERPVERRYDEGRWVTTFTVHMEPVTQGSMIPLGNMKMRHSNKVIAARKQIKAAAVAAGAELTALPVAITIKAYLSKPKSASKRVFPTVSRNDIDKIARCVLDALTDTCYLDDGQVIDLQVSKRYGEARLEIEVREVLLLEREVLEYAVEEDEA